MRKTVCVDLDGVLADYSSGYKGPDVIGDPLPGAVEFTRALGEFAEVVIYSVRCSPEFRPGSVEARVRPVREWLQAHGFYFDRIASGEGKPVACAYVDDRAVECDPQGLFGPELGMAAYQTALARCRLLARLKHTKE